jgi:nicotinate-nucleotide adenylyltransferase
MPRARLLIFGGTFDPPHRAHSELPPLVARSLRWINPLKRDEFATPAEHRLAMLRLALKRVPNAEISTVELDRPGPSYMIDTLRALRDQFGSDADLRLLIGSDQALQFRRWKGWREILQLATPAVMVRPPLDAAAYRRRLRQTYSAREAERWLSWAVPVPQLDICATRLRARLAENQDATELIDRAVLEYIREHDLY